MAEGGIVCRSIGKGDISFEFDFMFHHKESCSRPDWIRDIPGHPGFVTLSKEIRIDKLFPDRNDNTGDKVRGQNSQSDIDGQQFKQENQERVGFGKHDEASKLVVSQLFNIPPADIQEIRPKGTIEGPSVCQEWKVVIRPSREWDFSLDHVGSVHCDFWPDIASEWIHRSQRVWPKQSEIPAIVKKGFHVVPKSKTEEEGKQWRYSFSSAESDMAKLRNENQQKCFLLFKSIFYEHLKMKRYDKKTSTYLVKTVMLWVCEEHEIDVWTQEEYMLKRLLNYFRR